MSHHYIVTSTGDRAYFHPPWTDAATVSLPWLAHSLACINRFNGHAARPYSVAEHSLLCCEIAERDLGIRDPGALLAVLLHDAHEAIVGDMTQPLKLHLRWLSAGRSTYDAAEETAERLVQDSFGIRAAARYWRDQIKQCDLTALATERRDLLPADGGDGWACLGGINPVTWLELRALGGMTWQDWRQAFTDRVELLQEARRLRNDATGGAATGRDGGHA